MNRTTLITAKIFTVIGLVIILWFLLRGMLIENFINPKIDIDLTKAGTIGDFIGGLVGTIFALVGIFLLYETLSFQRQELSESKKVFIKQQFDNTFFELLKLYHQIIAYIDEETDDGNKKQRELFDFFMLEMQKDFKPQRTFALNRNQAIAAFQKKYVEHLRVTSVYFKTLYRLYYLIDQSEISEKDKKDYSKILRAQLSDSELFFIRYNAMTENGANSINYLNKYDILKHLSNFELLEFKDWWSKLDKKERNGLGYIFNEMKQVLSSLILDYEYDEAQRNFKNKRYSIYLESEEPHFFKITLTKDSSKNLNNPAISDGFDKFTDKEIENLLEGIVKEFLIVSNFNKYNNRRHLNLQSETTVNGAITTIEVSVSNKVFDPLIIKFEDVHNIN